MKNVPEVRGVADLATQDHRRYEILNVEKTDAGGITRFNDATAEQLRKLIELGFIDPDGNHNSSPSIAEMLRLSDQLGSGVLTFHGYIVSAKRADVSISIDAVHVHRADLSDTADLGKDVIGQLQGWAQSADEVDKMDNYVRLWWD